MDNERKRHSHEYQDLFNNIPGGAFHLSKINQYQ